MSFAKDHWNFFREKTAGFLERLSDEDLKYSPMEGFASLGRQLRHVGDSREIYIRSLEQGNGVSWETKRRDREMEISIEKLRSYFAELDERFDKATDNIDLYKVMDWAEMENPTVGLAIEYMTQHEVLHHGMWMLYIKGLGLDYEIK